MEELREKIQDRNLQDMQIDSEQESIEAPQEQQAPYDSAEVKKGMSMYLYYMIGSIIFAVFYTFCLYKNSYGITFPLFTAGCIATFYLFIKKREIVFKKDSIFYVISIVLLGISTCFTANTTIIFFNKAGIFILMLCFIIHQFYEDEKWSFLKYVGVILRTIIGMIECLGRPFQDSKWYKNAKEKVGLGNEKNDAKLKLIKQIVIGLVASIPLIMIIIGLLANADYVFYELVNTIFDIKIIDIILENSVGIIVLTVFAFFICYSTWTFMCKKNINQEEKIKNTREPVIAITFTSLISIIYIVFSVIQILYLFIGNMGLPKNYTYAEYAREGFFQLLFVCLINLVIVLLCITLFRKNVILKVILTIISICTFIMILSSAMRMIIYINAYDLSLLRIFVLWALVVIMFLMTGLTIMIYIDAFPLFRYFIIVVTACYLVLSFARPDYWIAKYNLSDIKNVDTIDYHYLQNLSADAAPIILSEGVQEKYPANEEINRYSYENWIWYYKLEVLQPEINKMKIRSFNFSIYKAKKLL